jgi:Skp family chaperone for outer membrane proteins
LSSWAADKEKIVYVDLQKVFLTSEQGKQAKKALDKEAEEKKAALEEKKKEFQKMKDELQKKIAEYRAILASDKLLKKVTSKNCVRFRRSMVTCGGRRSSKSRRKSS